MTEQTPRHTSKPFRVAVFDSVELADKAIERLVENGFEKDEITLFSPASQPTEHEEDVVTEQDQASSTETAVSGGAMGGVLGGATAVAGLATVAGAPIVVAGGMLGLLAGGVFGGLVGAMTSRGVEKEPADYYDQAVSEGKSLVAVEPHDENAERLKLATKILDEAGADPFKLREG
jgi:hypothetical protein